MCIYLSIDKDTRKKIIWFGKELYLKLLILSVTNTEILTFVVIIAKQATIPYTVCITYIYIYIYIYHLFGTKSA